MPPEFHPWIARLRVRCFQHYIEPAAVVVGYGARVVPCLNAIKARRKIAIVFSGSTVDTDHADAETAEALSALPEGIADVVICDHALEYETDPASVLLGFGRILKLNGTVIISTLYDGGFRSPDFESPAEHFYSWNVQTLGNLLTDCGFAVENGRVRRCPNEDYAATRALQYHAGESGFRFFARLSRIIKPRFEVCVVGKRV